MKFVGFLDVKKAIRFYNPVKRSVHESRNFSFGDVLQEAVSTIKVPGLRFKGKRDAATLPNPKEPDDDQPEKPKEFIPQCTKRNIKDHNY